MGIARIEGKHPLVDEFLDTSAAVTRSQSTARCAREQTGFDALGLGVIGDILDNNAPFSIDVLGAEWAGVLDTTGADVAFFTNPVALLEWISVVQGIIEMVFA